MPMPEPRAGESEEDFIDRCMGDSVMVEDFPDNNQRAAICHRQWRKKGVQNMERKQFSGIELKDDKSGSFTAKIASLKVIDSDGDVTLPGAFPDGKTILISAYDHTSWGGALPVGKGTVRESGDDVFVDGEFNLDTETGREHYKTLKFAPELSEWSYGFTVKDFESDAEFEGNRVSRILKALDVFEASPVLRGAGVGTGLVTIKNDKRMTLEMQASEAHTAVDDLLARVKSLTDLRREQGRKPMSDLNIERLKSIGIAITSTLGEIDELIQSATPPDGENVGEKARLEFLRIQSKIQGVTIE